MRTLDKTDIDIIGLLLENARRPYNDIADRVDVSAPTVSDRIDRLETLGIIQQFTVDLDRSSFTAGIDVMIEVSLETDRSDSASSELAAVDGIQHVFATADARVFAVGTLECDQIEPTLLTALDADWIDSYRVHLIRDRSWEPSLPEESIDLACATCGGTVDETGLVLRYDGTLYHFCDRDCRTDFEDQRSTGAGPA